jgi:predicted transposase/invertase (TIGR01784 family)
MSESDKRIVLEHMERLYRELYSQYRELTEVDVMLKNRLLTYSEEAELRGRKEGREEGKKEGREEGKKDMARRLLSRGISLDIIAESAELPLDTVKALIN